VTAWLSALFLHFEAELARAYVNAPPAGASLGAWRLVRTPNPRGGPEAVSVVHTAELGRSDADLAGLMLRCADQGFEVLVVLLEPFPLGAHPKVKLTAGTSTVESPATVVAPGAAIALAGEAAALAGGRWQLAGELTLDITDGERRIQGVVALTGLAGALSLLTAHCPRE
jgi:hypothetical protein